MATPDHHTTTIRFVAVSPDHPDAQACLSSYYAELAVRFPAGFDPANGNPTPEVEALMPPHGVFLVMRDGRGAPLGCGAVHRLAPDVAEIKRMWIDPSLRGSGWGRNLLGELERRAHDLGFGIIRLDTASPLTQAIAMYRSAGYREIDPYNENPYAHHWFEKTLPPENNP